MTLDHLKRQLIDKTERVAELVAREAETMLIRTAPVDTNFLRSQIRARVEAYATGAKVTIESAAPYAQFVREHREAWDELMRLLPSMIQRAWNRIP